MLLVSTNIIAIDKTIKFIMITIDSKHFFLEIALGLA
jgi:hypothetical protein